MPIDSTMTDTLNLKLRKPIDRGSLSMSGPNSTLRQAGNTRTLTDTTPGLNPIAIKMQLPQLTQDVPTTPGGMAPAAQAGLRMAQTKAPGAPINGIDLGANPQGGGNRFAFASNPVKATPTAPYYGAAPAAVDAAKVRAADFQSKTNRDAQAFGLIAPNDPTLALQRSARAYEDTAAAPGGSVQARDRRAAAATSPIFEAQREVRANEAQRLANDARYVIPATIKADAEKTVAETRGTTAENVATTVDTGKNNREDKRIGEQDKKLAFNYAALDQKGKTDLANADAKVKASATQQASITDRKKMLMEWQDKHQIVWDSANKAWVDPSTQEIVYAPTAAEQKEHEAIAASGKAASPVWGGWGYSGIADKMFNTPLSTDRTGETLRAQRRAANPIAQAAGIVPAPTTDKM